MGGEFYIWEMPRDKNNIEIQRRLSNSGGTGNIVKDTKIQTNSNRTKERIEEELRRRQAKIKAEGIRWSDDCSSKREEYKLGRTVEKAIEEELENREREKICRAVL